MVARGAAKPLSKLELAGRTVRQLLEVARRAGAVVPPGTNKQPLVDLLVKAKVTSAHLGDVGMQVAPPVVPLVNEQPRDDDSSTDSTNVSQANDSAKKKGIQSKLRGKAKRTRRHDSDSDDEGRQRTKLRFHILRSERASSLQPFKSLNILLPSSFFPRATPGT